MCNVRLLCVRAGSTAHTCLARTGVAKRKSAIAYFGDPSAVVRVDRNLTTLVLYSCSECQPVVLCGCGWGGGGATAIWIMSRSFMFRRKSKSKIVRFDMQGVGGGAKGWRTAVDWR
jgi:hypothetical protein